MKKNTMMRIASILLIAVLLSTSAISGTYAKYVSQSSSQAEARVAKWGVDFVMTSDLFKGSYEYDDKPDIAAATLSVKSEGGNVVAPGTSGNAYSFTTVGVPEVSYVVSFNADESTMENIFLLQDEEGTNVGYFPVVFTLEIGGVNAAIASQQKDDIVAAIEKCAYLFDVTEGKYYYTNAYTGEVSTTAWTEYTSGIPSLNLSWAWAFEQGTDNLDTMLGNLAAGKSYAEIETSEYNLEVSVAVTATATQID